MKIHILTFTNPKRPSPVTKKDLELLTNAAEVMGHSVEVIYSVQCQLKFGNGGTGLYINMKKRRNIKVVLVKANFLGHDIDLYNTTIKQFELAGINVINRHTGVIQAKNKIRTLQVLSHNNIPIPKTYVVRSSDYLEAVVEDIGSFPIILKSLSGSHGRGVSIVESSRGFQSIVEMLLEHGLAGPVIVQEYVKESKGKDIRVFVLGDRVVAAMQRIATRKGEFRSNFHLGGRVKVAELSVRERRLSIAAAKACGLEMAGIDLLRTKNGPKILEVNANPGLEGIMSAGGVDVASEVIKYVVKRGRAVARK
jgi:ribosomal protein S6--L-glutamate ligase